MGYYPKILAVEQLGIFDLVYGTLYVISLGSR